MERVRVQRGTQTHKGTCGAGNTQRGEEEKTEKRRERIESAKPSLMEIKHPSELTQETFPQPESLVLPQNIRFVFVYVPMETS